MILSSTVKRWKTSVAFKLATATAAIVVLVALLQFYVGHQTYRLTAVQDTILRQSVPMLQKTQEFARLTTKILGQTALLEEHLSVRELTALRGQYFENDREAEQILNALEANTKDADLIRSFREARKSFAIINEQMFENQLRQRTQEEGILNVRARLLNLTAAFEDTLNQMLVQSTTTVLSGRNQQSLAAGNPQSVEDLLRFAGKIETLNSLKGNVTAIRSILQSLAAEQKAFQGSGYAERLRLHIRSITQSLTLLQGAPQLPKLANLSLDINASLMSQTGFVALLREYEVTRARFNLIRKEQSSAIADTDQRVEEIVADVTARFETDIALASDVTRSIIWFGLATTALVFICIMLVNHFVIRKQISRRFTMLTEDVSAIAAGNFTHEIRVNGNDELGDIARALDQFKGQAAELERSNDELERFAYVAAHDLRSPLDAIQDLARWTLEDERHCLSEACIENLELLIKRSSRLSALQADLLTYAQVGEIDASIGPFRLKDEISKMADFLDPDNRFQITLENDPGTIDTFSLPTRQILINLLTNAIKHHDKATGKIVVRYTSKSGRHSLAVEDDGPGIEPRYQAKIFELFKTLKSRDTIEGSGLGLALISKLIDRLGGTLVVQSNAPDHRGTTFKFETNPVKAFHEARDVA